jgi:hypothetical protein
MFLEENNIAAFEMVKKRVRDQEILPEAPAQAAGGDDDSGSDEVNFLHCPSTTPLT